MKLSRKAALGIPLGAMAAAAQRYPAGAAEFTFKFDSNEAANHPVNVRAGEAAARILRESNGRLEVRVFPNGTLGGASQAMALLREGAIELADIGDVITEATVRVAGISAIPFAFATHQDAFNAMSGPLGTYVRNAMSKVGVYSFKSWWDIGFREVENSVRPVRVPADLKGLKLRIPPSPTLESLFKGLGVSPTPVEAAMQYTALQSHLIDGTEVPLEVVAARKMHEVEKYISLTNHVWTGNQIIASGVAWQNLPPNLRDVCERNFNLAARAVADDFAKLDTTLEAELTSQGALVNKVDAAAFKGAVRAAGLYAQWRDYYGPEVWTLLENAVGQLR